MMQIQIVLPDDIAHSLEMKWGNLELKFLEMLVLEAYLEGSIGVGKVRELLGFSTRLEVDAFLKAKGVDLQYDEHDFEGDRQTHKQLRREGKLNGSSK
ncbi:MAG: UPF0175 family protein [Scytonema sp. PMC 1069.18]|nr:UPF0175 family protein [Scytonema sp. PMC 1069.18]MEC4882208.1 UPF0175 family protein [Scytonema sp. PMC 1070.18]